MKVELAEYQADARDQVLRSIARARHSLERYEPKDTQDCHTVVLSAATGAGKTVIMAAVIETLFSGHPDGMFENDFPLDDPSVLWITGDPQLNAQTDQRLLGLLDTSWFNSEAGGLVTIDEQSFNARELPVGKVCFINTQRLGVGTKLVKHSNLREYTFWDTMTNTINTRPGSLIVIIDEAHQGALGKGKGRGTDAPQSIMQRFVIGHKEDNLLLMPPSPIIVGVSATPERFEKLTYRSGRQTHSVAVPVNAVRKSGLVKQQIRLRHPTDSASADITLLESALRRHRDFVDAWARHSQAGARVKPVTLVQVEDGSESELSKTDLEEVLSTISRALDLTPAERDTAVVHAFQDSEKDGEKWEYGGKLVTRKDPAKINDDHDVQVVIFKTALTTGWDCPRAEVMMSFRPAKDGTHIAQLVGRMVRAPLRRVIAGTGPDAELLNGVDLYLPRFDDEELENVVNRLSGEDSEHGTGTAARVFTAVDVAFNPSISPSEIDNIASTVSGLPTYKIKGRVKGTPVNRLMRMAGLLERDTENAPPIVMDAQERAVRRLCQWLASKLDDATQGHGFASKRQAVLETEIEETVVDYSTGVSRGGAMDTVTVSDIDLDKRMTRLDKEIGGKHAEIARSFTHHLEGEHATLTLREARATVLALLDDNTVTELGNAAEDVISEWADDHSDEIEKSPDAIREGVYALIRSTPEPEIIEPSPQLAEGITVPKPAKNSEKLAKHLYTPDGTEICRLKLNGWEANEVRKLVEDSSVVAWLRNERTKATWSLAIPWVHSDGTPRLVYPDLVAFRQDEEAGRMVADIIDPHGLHLGDAPRKIRGLAAYAKENVDNPALGRVIAIAEVDGRRRARDLSDRDIRDGAFSCGTRGDLEDWFRGDLTTTPAAIPHEAPSNPGNQEVETDLQIEFDTV